MGEWEGRGDFATCIYKLINTAREILYLLFLLVCSFELFMIIDSKFVYYLNLFYENNSFVLYLKCNKYTLKIVER